MYIGSSPILPANKRLVYVMGTSILKIYKNNKSALWETRDVEPP